MQLLGVRKVQVLLPRASEWLCLGNWVGRVNEE